MFTAELKINGCLISHIYIHNECQIGGTGVYVYSYEIYIVNEKQKKSIIKGEINHERLKGGLDLLRRILEKEKKNL